MGVCQRLEFKVSDECEDRGQMSKLPEIPNRLSQQYPAVWKAFNELGSCCHEAGPLDEKCRRLVKLALSMGAGSEGAVHSAVRNARVSGVSEEEIDHVALLAITTLGFPAAARAMAWVRDMPEEK